MRPGGEKRGSNKDRAARKTFLLTAPQWGGNGTHVPCVHCGTLLNREQVQADRIIPGGSYRRENIQPSCGPDNKSRSNKIDWTPPILRALQPA
jgi:hypothetical protein